MNLIIFSCLCVVSVRCDLQLVHVFFRHGSRTPEEQDSYPTDPYKDFEPMGWGQLTSAGKQMSYQLGRLLRKQYDSFLGEVYTPETAVTLSTDFDRTKMTALLVLAGLFPPQGSQKWSNELAWNPIPFSYEKAETDYFLRRPTHYCPAYVEELERVFKSDTVAKLLKENKETLDYIAENSGKPIEILMDVFKMYQTLNAEATMNLTLPEWTKSVYPKKIHDLAANQCYFENYSPTLKRLNGGRSLGKVIENMRAKAKNSYPGRKIYLYSGHENNVINILAALNLFEPHVPLYSAALIIELHYMEKTSSYAVKIFHIKDVYGEPQPQALEGCDHVCPFDKFLEICSPNVPQNYTLECGSRINLG